LTHDEINLLLAEKTGGSSAQGEDVTEIRRHLSECQECRALAEKHFTVERELMETRGKSQGDRRGPDCPSERDWMLLAAGLLPEAETVSRAEHAIVCDYCGPLLREATEDFVDTRSPEDEALIAELQASQPRGRQEMAARLSKLSGGKPERQRGFRWRPSFAHWPSFAIPAVAVALVAFFAWRLITPPDKTAERLIAQAYTKERTIDLRLPDAAYAPMRTERGTESSRVNRPAALLDAEALVAHNLASHPSDPKWLAAKGRIDLLEWNSESAIRSFKQALEAQPDSAQLKSGLASAYFERAEATNQPVDYGTAAEWYGRALAQNPNDPVAVFNRAITYERLFLYDQALQDWHHYLEVDPQGEWANEARVRLEALKQKMKDRNASALPLPAEASAALPVLSDRASQNDGPSDAHSWEEDYLPIALTQWLPSVYDTSRTAKSVDPEEAAVDLLAKLLSVRHGDEWLRDFLASPHSSTASRGVRELALAIQDNVQGNTEAAEYSAEHARQDFRAARNTAGELRSRFEVVYALKRAQRGRACLDAANRLVGDLGNRSYNWLRTQVLIEQSNCLYMVGELQAAVVGTNLALRQAEAAEYRTLYLRALGMAAAWETAKGDTAAAWQLDCRGLARYWAGHYDGLRAWQFYDDMGYGPRESAQWHLAVALGREAVAAVAVAGRPAEEAQARSRLATVAASAGQPAEAAAEFERAKRLYQKLPQSGSVTAFEANGEIALAELEYASGQYDAARARLQAVHADLPYLQSYTFPLRYYVTLGKLSLRDGDVGQAEADFHAAVLITELGLRSLADPAIRRGWERETGEAYRLLVRLLLVDRRDQFGALRVWEWFRAEALHQDPPVAKGADDVRSAWRVAIPFEALDSGVSLPSMQALDRVLPRLHDVTVLSYAWLGDGLAIWIFDSKGVHSQWVNVSQESLERVARRYSENCSDSATSASEIDRDGEQLYTWLIRPIEGFLPPQRLMVIEPDGPIGLIPFQALKSRNGQYFGATRAILFSPGIDLTGRHRDLNFPLDSALVIGVPSVKSGLTDGLPALPDAGLETEMVAEHFRQKTVLLGSEATRDAVLRELPESTVFHFAGHALSGPRRRGLLLAGAGTGLSKKAGDAVLLDSETIGGTPMSRCRLAVLSACSTAKTEDAMVDPQELAGAFLRAGVGNVVASRWNVDSQVTVHFMGIFYSRLQAGDTIPQALQIAAAEVRKDPRTVHPHYWAAFSSFGRT
jgi:CHAT domain-containing protein